MTKLHEHAKAVWEAQENAGFRYLLLAEIVRTVDSNKIWKGKIFADLEWYKTQLKSIYGKIKIDILKNKNVKICKT